MFKKLSLKEVLRNRNLKLLRISEPDFRDYIHYKEARKEIVTLQFLF